MDDSDFTYAAPSDPLLKRLAINALEFATGRDRLRRLYFQHQASGWEGASFFDVAIKALSLDLRYDAERLAALPKQGPLVVVSNHPFGVLDGIVMCALMRKARPDFLVLTNAVLLRAPEMRDHMLPIDFTETIEAQRANVASRAMAEPDFDRAKVESIKQAIQDGQYPLNPRKIAESFHAIEQMIRE